MLAAHPEPDGDAGRRIFGLTQLVSVRRMLGVGAVAYTLAHCVVFFWLIHYDWPTFVKETQRPTIWVATAATVGFLVLAATSLDSAVGKMGVWWNRVHNLTYVLTAAALVHFLLSRASTAGLPFVLAGAFFWLMAWRVLDRFKIGTGVTSLLALGLGVVVFTIGFEVVWLYFYRGRQLLRTLTGEFTLEADFFTPVPASSAVAAADVGGAVARSGVAAAANPRASCSAVPGRGGGEAARRRRGKRLNAA